MIHFNLYILAVTAEKAEDEESQVKGFKRWVEILCGLRHTDDSILDVRTEIHHIKTFLKQRKLSSIALNLAAVFLIVVVVFITVFYH